MEVKPGFYWAKWNGFVSIAEIVLLEHADADQVKVGEYYYHLSAGEEDEEAGYELISPIEPPKETE